MNEKSKNQHSMLSNICFFVSMLFKVSPLLVIGEFIWGILLILPSRLVSVIGVKYFIDVVTEGKDLHRIFYAVGAIAAVLVISKLLSWLFREFFWNMEKERVHYGLNKTLYEKAKKLDQESYDQPRPHLKKQRHFFANKGQSSQSYGFSSSHIQRRELVHKEG